MGTCPKITAQENVAIIQKMEEENLILAKRKGFAGIFATNTSPLTQQLSSDIYGFQTMVDYQVNQYVCPDGRKPFENAPDSQRVLVQWKDITKG